MILLDSDVIIDLLRKHPPALQWFGGVDDELVVPGVAAMELVAGTRDSDQLKDLQAWLQGCEISWLEPVDSQRALNLFARVHLRNAIGFADMLIAQTALRLGLPLHTFNVRHYAAIPALQTVQPYVR